MTEDEDLTKQDTLIECLDLNSISEVDLLAKDMEENLKVEDKPNDALANLVTKVPEQDSGETTVDLHKQHFEHTL